MVKPVPRKEVTTSGIYLPEAQQQQIPQGTIIAKGGTVTDELEIGDHVEWIIEYADSKEFMHEDELHLIMTDGSIVAKLEDV